jgi:mRNA interferase MazF
MPARGELWTVAGGVYATRPRPALIIQDDAFAATASVTVLPLTTTHVDAPLLRPHIGPSASNGLSVDSWIEIDKLTTVRRSHVGRRLGRISRAELAHVERLVAVFLGLAR